MTVDLPTLIGLPALGLYLLIAAQLLSRPSTKKLPKPTLRLLLALTLSLSCLLISVLLIEESAPRSTQLIFALLSAPNFFLFWLSIRNLFEDNFQLGKLEWGLGGSYLGLMIWERLSDIGMLALPVLVQVSLGIFSISLLAYLALSLLAGRKNDLVKNRRDSRVWLVSFLILAGFIAVGARNGVNVVSSDWGKTLSIAGISSGAFIAALYIFRLDPSVLLFKKNAPDTVADGLSALERQKYEKLMAYMGNEKAYLDPSLSIVKLAAAVGLGEHTLRSLINQRLGYRNYTDFINQYRITHAKSALDNPAQAHVPILTIGLESGYNSLSAFNRAFRRIEDITPSAYRKLKSLR